MLEHYMADWFYPDNPERREKVEKLKSDFFTIQNSINKNINKYNILIDIAKALTASTSAIQAIKLSLDLTKLRLPDYMDLKLPDYQESLTAGIILDINDLILSAAIIPIARAAFNAAWEAYGNCVINGTKATSLPALESLDLRSASAIAEMEAVDAAKIADVANAARSANALEVVEAADISLDAPAAAVGAAESAGSLLKISGVLVLVTVGIDAIFASIEGAKERQHLEEVISGLNSVVDKLNKSLDSTVKRLKAIVDNITKSVTLYNKLITILQKHKLLTNYKHDYSFNLDYTKPFDEDPSKQIIANVQTISLDAVKAATELNDFYNIVSDLRNMRSAHSDFNSNLNTYFTAETIVKSTKDKPVTLKDVEAVYDILLEFDKIGQATEADQLKIKAKLDAKIVHPHTLTISSFGPLISSLNVIDNPSLYLAVSNRLFEYRKQSPDQFKQKKAVWIKVIKDQFGITEEVANKYFQVFNTFIAANKQEQNEFLGKLQLKIAANTTLSTSLTRAVVAPLKPSEIVAKMGINAANVTNLASTPGSEAARDRQSQPEKLGISIQHN